MVDREPRVLLVADCHGIEHMIKDLQRHGFDAEMVTTGEAAIAATDRDFDVFLVDLDLEDFDGLTLCKRVRETSGVPMIGFASVHEPDRVLALEGGCDDCITKPYPSRELMARLWALLRRVQSTPQPILAAGQLEIDPTLHEVRVGGQTVGLTRKEFELLHLLAAEPNKVFSRPELLRRVWGYNDVDAEVTSLASRTIDTHLSSIRKKLGSPDWIVTVRGIGFRFSNDTASESSGPDKGTARPGETAG